MIAILVRVVKSVAELSTLALCGLSTLGHHHFLQRSDKMLKVSSYGCRLCFVIYYRNTYSSGRFWQHFLAFVPFVFFFFFFFFVSWQLGTSRCGALLLCSPEKVAGSNPRWDGLADLPVLFESTLVHSVTTVSASRGCAWHMTLVTTLCPPVDSTRPYSQYRHRVKVAE